MPAIKVKWNHQEVLLEMDFETATVGELKTLLEVQTSVPMSLQRLVGLKGGSHVAEAALLSSVVDPTKPLKLIGNPLNPAAAAGASTAPPLEPPSKKKHVPHTTAPADNPQKGGLVNIGNTCYLSAGVQTLRAIPAVRNIAQMGSSAVEKQLAELIDRLGDAQHSITPTNFWATFTSVNRSFLQLTPSGALMQHDAQEALNILLAELGKTLQLPQFLNHRHLFEGETTVLTEDGGEQAAVPFTMLSCVISEDVKSLEYGLKKSMDGVEGEGVRRRQQLSLLPEFLFINLLRFTWRRDTNTKAKVLRDVVFPLTLDVFDLCLEPLKETMKEERELLRVRRDAIHSHQKWKRQRSPENPPPLPEPRSAPATAGNQSALYELCAVISHRGRTADGGHYVAWVKQTNSWQIFDDEHVADVSEKDVLQLQGGADRHMAYILLYRSRHPLTHEPALP